MGTLLLSLLLLGMLAGCERQPAAAPDGAAPVVSVGALADRPDPHARIACSGCHQGGRADFGRASVPAASCTASGCHEDGGAERVRLATATFEHRRHGEGGEIQPSCAGCHTHPEGGEPLRASVDACVLCHLPQITSGAAEDCQVCHQQTQHVTLTSAGLPVAHANLPWVEIGCVRCHYDVADPPIEVPSARCADCHRDVAAVTRRGIGMDLHPPHAGVTCTACHAAGGHQVREVSSAVQLVCGDCHTNAHELVLAPWQEDGDAWAESAACGVCHVGVHGPQQQMLLGLVPEWRAAPARKFLLGMTCRSCHVPPAGGPPLEPIRGQALACRSCHEPEYDRVLEWWLQGVDQRLRATHAYLRTARTELGAAAPDSARRLISTSVRMLALVDSAGGQHNLELADRIFRETVRRTEEAYRLAGLRAPPAPALGRPPHLGLCSGCHYATGPLDLRVMPPGFHEQFVRERVGAVAR